jgi:sulfate transport system substrate-binding protein
VKVLTPNPQTSGAARWNILALYGSVLKQGGSADEAEQSLRALYRNVVTLGESGRATTQDFERGIGDVALTYENETLLFRKQGKEVEFVIPSSTIYIENPAAVVDTYADKHGVKNAAEAFVSFLRSPEVQKILVNWGFRSIDDSISQENAERFPTPPQAFDVELLGGWPKIQKDFFEPGGLWEKIIQTERRGSR